MLPKFMVATQAWQSLSHGAVATFIEVAVLYNGSNNGMLGVSTRSLAQRRNCSNSAAARFLIELRKKGFVEVVRASGFNVKDRTAAEYRLTLYQCNLSNAKPTFAFKYWQPDSKTQSQNTETQSHQWDVSNNISQFSPSGGTATLQTESPTVSQAGHL